MYHYTVNSGKKQSKNAGHGILRVLLAAGAAAGLLAVLLLAFFSLLAAGGCAAEKLTPLRTFAGVHTGVYACESAALNGEDVLRQYRSVTVELREDGTFLLRAAPAKGEARQTEGEYGFDEESGILELRGSLYGKRFAKRCVYEDGAFTVLHTSPGLRFAAKFRMLP